jgi:glutamate 5-kinase
MQKAAINLANAHCVVIKIGSALVVDQQSGNARISWLRSLVEDVVALRALGIRVVIVSSGAVALGRKYIPIQRAVMRLEEKQAAAACGQIELVRYYRRMFAPHGVHAAQILLTLRDSEDRRRYLNARNTLQTLLNANIVPVINENDTVATTELRFGDNDRLAARVAQMVGADVLVLLSDIDGLYSANPKLYPDAVHLPIVHEISPEIEAMAGNSISNMSSGGMVTKIEAAKIAMMSGCYMAILKGKRRNPLQALLEERAKVTWFTPQESPANARKTWIASMLQSKGELIVDDGALRALRTGKSLLPAGVVDIRGKFDRGDPVIIRDCRMKDIGRGLVAYASEDAELIKGHHSREIENIVGFSGRDELVHRDDMVLWDVKE